MDRAVAVPPESHRVPAVNTTVWSPRSWNDLSVSRSRSRSVERVARAISSVAADCAASCAYDRRQSSMGGATDTVVLFALRLAQRQRLESEAGAVDAVARENSTAPPDCPVKGANRMAPPNSSRVAADSMTKSVDERPSHQREAAAETVMLLNMPAGDGDAAPKVSICD